VQFVGSGEYVAVPCSAVCSLWGVASNVVVPCSAVCSLWGVASTLQYPAVLCAVCGEWRVTLQYPAVLCAVCGEWRVRCSTLQCCVQLRATPHNLHAALQGTVTLRLTWIAVKDSVRTAQ